MLWRNTTPPPPPPPTVLHNCWTVSKVNPEAILPASWKNFESVDSLEIRQELVQPSDVRPIWFPEFEICRRKCRERCVAGKSWCHRNLTQNPDRSGGNWFWMRACPYLRVRLSFVIPSGVDSSGWTTTFEAFWTGQECFWKEQNKKLQLCQAEVFPHWLVNVSNRRIELKE